MTFELWMPPALKSRRMRVYVAGHLISVIGTWFQTIALSWLVYRLTGSAFMLGLTGFALQLPYLFISPFAGMAVDRFPRVTLLIVVDCVLAALALLLAVMAFRGVSDPRLFIGVALLIGIANAIETPARQSLFTVLVDDRALLPSVIGISSATFNLGRLLGPALAGLALVYVPESVCFLLNALSFAAIVAALVAMRLPNGRPDRSPEAPVVPVGFSTIIGLPAVQYLLPTMAAIGFFGIAHVHLMPSIADRFFGGGSGTVGLLMATTGVGALGASISFTFARSGRLMLRLVRYAPLLLGAGVLVLATSQSLTVGVLALLAIGFAVMASAASTNTLIQQSVPEEQRGRAISLYLMAYNGMGPFGHLLSGALAEWIGLRWGLAINGFCLLAIAVFGLYRLGRHPDAQLAIQKAARVE
jgi:MFS family permease